MEGWGRLLSSTLLEHFYAIHTICTRFLAGQMPQQCHFMRKAAFSTTIMGSSCGGKITIFVFYRWICISEERPHLEYSFQKIKQRLRYIVTCFPITLLQVHYKGSNSMPTHMCACQENLIFPLYWAQLDETEQNVPIEKLASSSLSTQSIPFFD